MKKFGVFLIILGVALYAIAFFMGVSVWDNPEIKALSSASGIPIRPENATALLARPEANTMSGIPHWLLSVYPHVSIVSAAGIGCAGLGLLVIILSLVLKPLLSLILLAAIIGVCYFAYQGNLGPAVQSFMQGVIRSVQDLINQAITWVRRVPPVQIP